MGGRARSRAAFPSSLSKNTARCLTIVVRFEPVRQCSTLIDFFYMFMDHGCQEQG